LTFRLVSSAELTGDTPLRGMDLCVGHDVLARGDTEWKHEMGIEKPSWKPSSGGFDVIRGLVGTGQ
jgi:hypothetical protein